MWVVVHAVRNVVTRPRARQGGCLPQDVGVVTPYSAQVTRLRRRLAVFDGRRADGHFVECSSVDAFQGREKDVIVISTVRANRDGQVGFLSDWRRYCEPGSFVQNVKAMLAYR